MTVVKALEMIGGVRGDEAGSWCMVGRAAAIVVVVAKGAWLRLLG